MRDKLIEIIENGERKVLGQTIRGTSHYTEALADYLIANKVFVLPENVGGNWELGGAFLMRLFVADEAEIEKIKQEFELQKIKKILTDIRDYLVSWRDNNAIDYSAERWIDETALADLTEYAEKLGVKL